MPEIYSRGVTSIWTVLSAAPTPFGRPQPAAGRARATSARLANYVNQNNIDLVLLAGDLFDSAALLGRDSGRELSAALAADGGAGLHCSPATMTGTAARQSLPDGEVAGKCAYFHSAPVGNNGMAGKKSGAPRCGLLPTVSKPTASHWLHRPRRREAPYRPAPREIDPSEARYDPIRKEEIAASGLAYLALGHIHKRAEPLTFGGTVCAWPGCPEGRGSDEWWKKAFIPAR
ncbi:MAG: hypothetical protein ACLU38_12725 [Dysosmobacter sp.]